MDKGDLEKVAGGAADNGSLNSLEEVENAPALEQFKSWLGKYKNAGHHKNAEATLVNAQRCAISLGYNISFEAARGFIKKYWDLV